MHRPVRRIDPGAHDLTFEEFQLLYGSWRPLRPSAVGSLLQHAPFQWWVAGGWALCAAGAPPRFHEDIDIAILAKDVGKLRSWLSDYHLWEASSGALRPLREGDRLTDGCEQLWVRRDANSPWVMDILLTPSEGGTWLFKRDRGIRRPLSEIGRVGMDGVTYLCPEIVMLFKAHLSRGKDDADFNAVLPSLSGEAQRWLAVALAATRPDHPWIARLNAERR